MLFELYKPAAARVASGSLCRWLRLGSNPSLPRNARNSSGSDKSRSSGQQPSSRHDAGYKLGREGWLHEHVHSPLSPGSVTATNNCACRVVDLDHHARSLRRRGYRPD